MERLFGIPLDTLSVALLVLAAAAFGTIAVLAVRNRVFFRLGTRNVTRRKARSGLIVAGLMLATAIIASALVTGDTMGYTVRAEVLRALGETDEMVSVEGAEVDPMLAQDTVGRPATFDARHFDAVANALAGSALVDGVTPAIVEPVAVQSVTRRQTEPRVTLFGADPARMEGFAPMRAGGEEVALADLTGDGVYLNEDAAEELQAEAGDRLMLFAGSQPSPATVAEVVSFDGAGDDGPAVLAPLARAQSLLGLDGRIEHVLVSNDGDATSGARHSDAVVDLLNPQLEPLGLEATAAKADGFESADEQGNVFLTLFSTFGTFSIVAGILLIFLIFVMLAAERRGEMGIARAVGTQRGHLVQGFVFEGAVYDVLAAAVGALIGLGVAYAMVEMVGSAFSADEIQIEHHVRATSLLVAYGLGVVLTLVIVALSAWRVSRLDIVAAIRNLPSPVARKTKRANWVRGVAGIAVGALIAAGGLAGKQGTPFLLGVSIVLASMVPVPRPLGLADRAAYTLGGILVVVWWLLPASVTEPVTGDLKMDFSVWVVSGILIVVGATWTVMYNADLILNGLTRVASRVPALAPVFRMAVAYPLRSKGRTGMTLAMFMLVVFTLVTGTTISGSFISSFDNVEGYSGGFDVRAVSAPVRPIDDFDAALDEVGADRSQIEAVGGQSYLPVEAKQIGTANPFGAYPLRGLDEAFLETSTYNLAAMARGYDTEEEVWETVAAKKGLAVVDGLVAPRRNQYMFQAPMDFKMEGFYVEDRVFDAVDVRVVDPSSGERMTLRVIGVLGDDLPFEMAGISTSQATLAPFGERARPTTFWVRLAEGVDPTAAAHSLESAFLSYGLEAEALSDMLDEAVSGSWTINRLIQGFMGLGLVVGVVALGVISARAVVERRQQIGVLRAIGFQPAMVRLAFLTEASFISMTAIVVGSVLGLILSYNVVTDAGAESNVTFMVPWSNLLVVFAVVQVAALASTLLPAIRGSKVYPAEALRYE